MLGRSSLRSSSSSSSRRSEVVVLALLLASRAEHQRVRSRICSRSVGLPVGVPALFRRALCAAKHFALQSVCHKVLCATKCFAAKSVPARPLCETKCFASKSVPTGLAHFVRQSMRPARPSVCLCRTKCAKYAAGRVNSLTRADGRAHTRACIRPRIRMRPYAIACRIYTIPGST